MANDNEVIKRIGLENVVVAESELSFIDGHKPELIYRGYDITDLAENSTFEETTYLLWNGELPTREELEDFSEDFRKKRELPDEVLEIIKGTSVDAVPMDVLRTAVSALQLSEEYEDASEAGVSILAKTPTILAAYERIRRNEKPIEPREELGHAANFLYMMEGEEPSDTEAEILDTCLLLHADHGMNASTFTGRVIASTESDIYSALTGAISALKGPRHGGANQDVMELLLEIEDSDMTPTEYVEDMLDRGERVPGFGHRVYKTMDPRAVVLKNISGDLSNGGPDWYGMLTDIEEYLREEKNIVEKGIAPNVDFYSGSVYYSLGIPIDMFTPMFAMGRSAGWVAQILEQYDDSKIMRPRAEYVGERDQEYVPIEER